MIPCFICKKDSIGGFTYGLPTTPLTQHVGLCPEHNTLENKKAAILHWIETTQASVAAFNESNLARYAEPVEYSLTVYYQAGGTASFRCMKWNVPDQATLQVLGIDGQSTFIPLTHIELFEVMPVNDPNKYTPHTNVKERYSIVQGVPTLDT
ncbi:hypothetical protein [Halodesulfovibrio spirochaetisodalis]|uniref:Uncharacterized protein n=1 Tax=Halodesulfovibrio spirochaetisodalis TaxID=1560234 RepID=A0A1B7XBI6_9BACT|nr:hypothetical protein [Halodesulfovibrio spirochaetisodalis]OBQ50125.1 hypothetical protein SP90_10840 [Halodesulfovibrio spirochaetisodalis]